MSNPDNAVSFQQRVDFWMQECFGPEISADITERNHRFLEEALELVQSKGCTQSEAHQLVDYVFGRDVGEPFQEVGGVEVTLAALCLAAGIDKQSAGEAELARVWTKVDKIRAKQAAKPKHSPLPAHLPPNPRIEELEARVAELEAEKAKWQELAGESFHHSADIERERFTLAAERDALAAQVKVLREALEPFSSLYEKSPMLQKQGPNAEFQVEPFIHDNTVMPGSGYWGDFSKADLIAASKALHSTPSQALTDLEAKIREECAQIAEMSHQRWKDHPGSHKVECDVTACEDIATAIRNQGQEE